MAELVPQDGFPVDRAGLVRSRSVGGDDAAEAHAEVARVVGHAEGADAEIFLLREDLHERRQLQLHGVLGAQVGPGALQEREHARAVHLRLVAADAHDEVGVRERDVLGHRVVERHEVVGGHVVAVDAVDLLRELPSLGLVAEAQKVVRELRLRRKVRRVGLEGLALVRGTFGEAVLLRELEADEVVDARVVRPEAERGRAGGGLGGGVVLEVREHGAIGPRVGLPRVHRGDLVEAFGRAVIILGVDAVVGDEQEAGDVPWIGLERGLEGIAHDLAFAGGVGLGQPEEQVGVLGMFPDPFVEGFGREVEVMLLQREIAAREVDIAQVRIGLLGGGVDLVEDHLGVGPEQQRRAAEGDHAGGIAQTAASRGDGFLDVVEHRGSAAGVAGGEERLAGEPAQADAAGVLRQRVGHRGAGLGIAAGRQQRASEQQRPFLVALAVLQRLGRDLDHLGVLSLEQEVTGFRGIRGAGNEGRRDQEPEQPARCPCEADRASVRREGFAGGGHGADSWTRIGRIARRLVLPVKTPVLAGSYHGSAAGPRAVAGNRSGGHRWPPDRAKDAGDPGLRPPERERALEPGRRRRWTP